MKDESTNRPKAAGAPNPSQGKAPGLTIADVHHDAVMMAALIQGAEVLSWENGGGQHKHAGNALAALFPEIQRKADELAADLDRLDTGCRVGPANGGVENHANAITAHLGIRRNETSVALACRAFVVSETCYRYGPKLRAENEEIADLLVGLTDARKTWGFGLCFLHLRNVKGYRLRRPTSACAPRTGCPARPVRPDSPPQPA